MFCNNDIRRITGGILATCTISVVSVGFGSSASADDDAIRSIDVGDGWTITVRPRTTASLPVDLPSPAGPRLLLAVQTSKPKLQDAEKTESLPETDAAPDSKGRMSYAAAYKSIPFSRAEYLANPSYRHEAALEIMFGKMRPMTIHKTQAARIVPPARRPGGTSFSPFGMYDYSRGPYSRYMGLFGNRGGFRAMYDFNGGYGGSFRP